MSEALGHVPNNLLVLARLEAVLAVPASEARARGRAPQGPVPSVLGQIGCAGQVGAPGNRCG